MKGSFCLILLQLQQTRILWSFDTFVKLRLDATSLIPIMYLNWEKTNTKYFVLFSKTQQCIVIAQWVHLHLSHCSPGLESQAYHLLIVQFCTEKRTKKNKKRPALAHIFTYNPKTKQNEAKAIQKGTNCRLLSRDHSLGRILGRWNDKPSLSRKDLRWCSLMSRIGDGIHTTFTERDVL